MNAAQYSVHEAWQPTFLGNTTRLRGAFRAAGQACLKFLSSLSPNPTANMPVARIVVHLESLLGERVHQAEAMTFLRLTSSPADQVIQQTSPDMWFVSFLVLRR